MSIDALNWAFRVEDISSSQKFVLVAMSDFANEEWECYPSTETVCRKTNLDRKTVLSAVADLIDSGFLEDSGERKGRTKSVKVYHILKQSRNRDSSQNTVLSSPETGLGKLSQKRDIEPSGINHQEGIRVEAGASNFFLEPPSKPVKPLGKPRLKPFTPPTKQEVIDYSLEKGYKERDGEIWWLKQETKGWLFADKIPMRQWKSAFDNEALRRYLDSQKAFDQQPKQY